MINLLDIAIIFILLMFIITGIKRGVIKECISLVGIIIVFILSFAFKSIIGNLLCYLLPFFNFGGSIEGLTTINIFFYQAIAFILTFSILLGLYAFCLKISKIIQKIVNATIILWIPSAILGGIVSLLKGYIVVYAMLILLVIPFGNVPIIRDSSFVNTMLHKTPVLSAYVNKFIKPLDDVYKLGDSITKKDITVNEANLKALDIMLENKIVSKNTVSNLVKMHKLDNVKGIDNVLSKY